MIQTIVLYSGQNMGIRLLNEEDLSAILMLQQKVASALVEKGRLSVLTTEEVENLLAGNGVVLGAFLKDRLIAFRALLIPEIDEEHLAKDVGLDPNEWEKVIYSEVSNVDPDFRGHRLQFLLGELLMCQIDRDRFHYICATVAPFNIPSLKDKFAHGMKIVSLTKKYGGHWRYTFFKAFHAETDAPKTKYKKVRMEEIATQQQLLAERWVGTAIEKEGKSWAVVFEKAL